MEPVLEALQICPGEVRRAVTSQPGWERLEEIRFRLGREVQCCRGQQSRSLRGLQVTEELLRRLLDSATGHSVYGAGEMLRRGFLPLAGGHRLGLCGTGVYRQGALYTMKDLTSMNLRVGRMIPGAGEGAAELLWREPASALILGPPGAGKTTLLRALIRKLSGAYGWTVGVVDERMELGAWDLGPNADVLLGIRKEEGIEMLTRGMNPRWIAVDEITSREDGEAMVRAACCGVRFLATAHGEGREDLSGRPLYRSLLENRVFRHLLVLQPDRSIRKERLYDENSGCGSDPHSLGLVRRGEGPAVLRHCGPAAPAVRGTGDPQM